MIYLYTMTYLTTIHMVSLAVMVIVLIIMIVNRTSNKHEKVKDWMFAKEDDLESEKKWKKSKQAFEYKTISLPTEPWCIYSDYIIIEGHYYMLNSDGETASFICWSKEAWDIYHKYHRFLNLYIEAALDEFDYYKEDLDFFDKKRIKIPEKICKIPREITHDGKVYPIMRIRCGAFAFCEINSLIIPNTIVHIEEDAFLRCDGLKEMIIPNNLCVLASRAISGCKDLETITWRGTTYEDDIDELFIFPDYKDKYAIVMNQLKQCAKGHYYTGSDTCPYCGSEEAFIPRCLYCGEPIRKSIPDVKWPMVGSLEGGAYDHKVPWNYGWDGICENCGHDFTIKMVQDLNQQGTKRETIVKVASNLVRTHIDAGVGLSGVEIEQHSKTDGTTKMFISTNELRFLMNALKRSPILEQWDWRVDWT